MKKIIIFVLLFASAFQNAPMLAQADEDFTHLEEKINALQDFVARYSITWNPSVQKPVSEVMLRESINTGVSWLVASQEENGHFAYEYVPYEDEYKNDDNIVRQAGALYALGEVVRKSEAKNTKTNIAIEKSIGYFEMFSPVHEFEGTEMRCITKSERSKVCKLGASSLALVGILGYVDAEPKKAKEYESLIEGYVAFILKSKKDTTGFRDQYTVGQGFRGLTESPFSNGEALLALVRYYQYNNDAEVKKVIDESFEYLKVQTYDANLYLWIMASLKDMQVLWPSFDYQTYGKAFTFWRVGMIQSAHTSSHNYCAANEGFASAYTLLEKKLSVDEVQTLRTEIDFWNSKNIGLQIGETERLRVSHQDGKLVFKTILNTEKSGGGFLTSDAVPTQRIDFTQHCINTYLQTLVDIDRETL
jgi:hypothetical protein